MLGNEQSNHSYKEIGVPEGHHDLSHHGGDASRQKQLATINRFHADQVAYFLKRLHSIQETDGSLLDNSMIVYGAGISDGDRHNHDDCRFSWRGEEREHSSRGGICALRPKRR